MFVIPAGNLLLFHSNCQLSGECPLRPESRILAVLAILLLCVSSRGQTATAALNPPATLSASALPPTLTSPTTHAFHDPIYKLSFDYPANWTFSHTDHEISTFRFDARTAPRNAIVRAVVAMPENPFPASTFSGAYLYFSVTPHATAAACARQAAPPVNASHKPAPRPVATHVNDIPFLHGHDEIKDICITQRDEVYTTFRHGACYRFDLSINNFCGGEVSGVKDISPSELDQVRARLQSILNTIRFHPE